MRTSVKTVVVAGSLLFAAHLGSASAQTDAETAFQNARKAFANERFEEARDLLETASQTDAENPDIFLLLGRAHYQLGELDPAIAAWRQTLKLAPAQAYAQRMVDTLQGKIFDADVRLKIVESLLQEQLPQLAQSEIFSLKRGSLSGPQLVRLLSLEAEAMIDLGQAGEALKALRELVARDPDQSATANTRLLTGKVKLALEADSIAEGLAILTAVKAEFADAAEGAAADLALISFRLDQGEDAIDELAAWIAANPQHVDRHAARQTMVRAVSVFLQEAARRPILDKDDALSEADSRVLAAAEHALTLLEQADESLKLANQLVTHIQTRLIANGSFAAANAALLRLMNLELPTPSRTAFQMALDKSKRLAASEQLELILVAIKDADGSPKALANWIQTHAQHPSLREARRRLVSAYLEQTLRQGNPSADTELTASDKAAILVAGKVLQSLQPGSEKAKLIHELLAHLKSHYATHGANAAAISGQRAILDLQLPRVVRRAVLSELADTQTEVALSRLEIEISAGRLEAGPLPADLVAVMKTFAAINQEFPDQTTWSKQASVGARIVALSQRIEWPAKVTQIKATDGWALEFVLPVIAADHDVNTMKTASSAVSAIVDCVAAIGQESARGLAATTHQRLLDLLPEDHPLWPQSVIRQLSLRIADDASSFQENVYSGRGQRNAKLSEDQKSILALASTLVGQRPRMAQQILSELEPFFELRKNAGYGALVQQSYALLEESLPPPQLRSVRLAVAQSWVDQVIAKHTRLLANGFQPPEELDQRLQQALVRCYELASDLEPGHEFVKVAQRVRSTVIAHYRNLRYQETAAEAIKVKAEQGADWLDAAAEFELASLRMSIALDELANQTRQFQGRENITLTPAVKQAVAGFEQFVRDRPTDRLVSQAVSKILSAGRIYEIYEKYDIAAQIYVGLETFAANHEALQQAKPNTATVAQRAAHAVAIAMHIKASKTLAETMNGQPDDADPPAELSAEFQQAITAYQAIITKYPDSPLISSAIGKLMEIASQHASVGAWDVAESVYVALQAQQLPLRQPERLDFARALCEMGKVIPRHARQLLAAITLWERQTRTADEADSQLAMGGFDEAPGVMRDLFGGGVGGAGMTNQSEEMMMEMMEMGGAVANAPAAAETSQLDDLFGAAAAVPEVADQIVGDFAVDSARAVRERDLLAAVRRQQSALASQVAMLRDNEIQHLERDRRDPAAVQQGQQAAQHVQAIAVPVLSDAEIARRQTILDVAYTKLQAIRRLYMDSTTAGHAREQILVIINHWRSIKQWQRSAELVKRFLADNPTDSALPSLRHEIARDYLAWAASTVKPDTPKQELLDEVNKRFTLAREELSGIIAAFPDHQSLKHQAQWDIATSHLSQARVVAGFSSTLARGQFVRAANELLATADLYHDHPQIGELPQMLWNIAQELTNRRFYDEAIAVWNEMTLHYPGDPLAEQAALRIAQTYQTQLRLPLRAVESYLELNFARGGSDPALQDSIFQIATQLMSEKRWVESLHVLETFVDSFPTHASAGQALTMIGQVHQTNEVWADAIAAYRRVILEYDQGNWAQQSKWSIAECTINLSRWEEAQDAYREYQTSYPKDAKVAEATSRLEILKDLARFQKVVDEPGQRKAFDAQYQIASIVRTKLANPVKAIIEYRKVAQHWPQSHLADDALFQVGMIYMELSQTERARDAFLATAEKYPTSPLADDALFQVGASFENESQTLAGVTRGKAIAIANELAQKQAYAVSQGNRRFQRAKNLDQITQLKKEGKREEADKQTAFQAAQNVAFDQANASVVASWAAQQEAALTTAQLADRQDKINAALRKAVASFRRAASVASADKADDALLRMAQIYDQRLKDSDAAMSTWLDIVKQYSGTTVAEDASWKIAQYYETHEKYADAISAYNSFLRNYRRSPKASDAQAAIAENHEQLGNWVEAMDAYTNYINNYPQGAMATKAKEQIAWIKTYRL